VSVFCRTVTRTWRSSQFASQTLESRIWTKNAEELWPTGRLYTDLLEMTSLMKCMWGPVLVWLSLICLSTNLTAFSSAFIMWVVHASNITVCFLNFSAAFQVHRGSRSGGDRPTVIDFSFLYVFLAFPLSVFFCFFVLFLSSFFSCFPFMLLVLCDCIETLHRADLPCRDSYSSSEWIARKRAKRVCSHAVGTRGKCMP
jgi:hypothetical protein